MAQFAGGALPAEAQDRGGFAVAGQEGRDVAVLAAVADEGLAEAGPAGRDVGGDPRGDGVAGLLVRGLRHAVHDGRRAAAAGRAPDQADGTDSR